MRKTSTSKQTTSTTTNPLRKKNTLEEGKVSKPTDRTTRLYKNIGYKSKKKIPPQKLLPSTLWSYIFRMIGDQKKIVALGMMCKVFNSASKANVMWLEWFRSTYPKTFASIQEEVGDDSELVQIDWRSKYREKLMGNIGKKKAILEQKFNKSLTNLQLNVFEKLARTFEFQFFINMDRKKFSIKETVTSYNINSVSFRLILSKTKIDPKPDHAIEIGATSQKLNVERIFYSNKKFSLSQWESVDKYEETVHLHTTKDGKVTILTLSEESIAFISFNIHYIDLMYFFLHDSYFIPEPIIDDVDPRIGLHDYNLFIEIRDNKKSLWSSYYQRIDCHKDINRSKKIAEFLIYSNEVTQTGGVERIDGVPCFQWKTVAFSGNFNTLCTIDFLLRNEFHQPVWCYSKVVKVQQGNFMSATKNTVDFNKDYNAIHCVCKDEQYGQIVVQMQQEGGGVGVGDQEQHFVEDDCVTYIDQIFMTLDMNFIKKLFKSS